MLSYSYSPPDLAPTSLGGLLAPFIAIARVASRHDDRSAAMIMSHIVHELLLVELPQYVYT